KLTNEQVKFIRNNPNGLSMCELAKLFGVDRATVNFIQLGKTYKNAGGIIRSSTAKHIYSETRNKIRAEYQAGVKGYGKLALSKKYGVGRTTILKIVKEVVPND
ncbi:MAG: hypothetical protein II968_02355, partial [Selenomonadaceae bacterium]|nr:hypothetical protein [Selenomonadaceae bacterium]